MSTTTAGSNSRVFTKADVGQRWITTDGYTSSSRDEVVVVEVSPSGKNVKLKFTSGYEGWEENDGWSHRKLEKLP